MTLRQPSTAAEWGPMFGSYVVDWENAVAANRLPEDWLVLFDEAAGRQQELLTGGAWSSGPRSLLGVIGQRQREQVHSAVLAWLLDPNGRHGLRSRFLERFLTLCQLPVEWADSHVVVVTEESCFHPEIVDRYGFADVVVRGSGWSLIIENKLWAGQHGDQLDLYYDAYVPVGGKFVYLTPEGVGPRSTRREVVDAFRPASWRRHVLPELRAAICDSEEVSDESCLAAREYVIALEEELA